MQLREIMTKNVDIIPLDGVPADSARKMRDRDVGAIPFATAIGSAE